MWQWLKDTKIPACAETGSLWRDQEEVIFSERYMGWRQVIIKTIKENWPPLRGSEWQGGDQRKAVWRGVFQCKRQWRDQPCRQWRREGIPGGGHRKGKSPEVGRAVWGLERRPLQQESMDQGTGWGKSSESWGGVIRAKVDTFFHVKGPDGKFLFRPHLAACGIFVPRACMLSHFSHVWCFASPWTVAH